MIKKVYFLLIIISTLFGCTKEVTNTSQSSGNSTSNNSTNSTNNNTNADLPYADFTFDGKNYFIKSTSIITSPPSSSTELPKCFTDNYTGFILFDDKHQYRIEVDLPKKAGVFQLTNIECDGYVAFDIISDSGTKEFCNHVLFRGELSNGTLNYDGKGKCIFEANLYDVSPNNETDASTHKIKGTFYVPSKLL
jgi:hypothetical protein